MSSQKICVLTKKIIAAELFWGNADRLSFWPNVLYFTLLNLRSQIGGLIWYNIQVRRRSRRLVV
jgi:hypothetical protein